MDVNNADFNYNEKSIQNVYEDTHRLYLGKNQARYYLSILFYKWCIVKMPKTT